MRDMQMMYWMPAAVMLSLILAGGCDGGKEPEGSVELTVPNKQTVTVEQPKLKWDTIANEDRLDPAVCPSIYEFLGGYTDPLVHRGTNKLSAHLDDLVADIGGWDEVEKILHQDEWIFGINGTPCCCPVCEPDGYRRGAKYLILKKGNLVCSKCGTTLYPSEKYSMNHTVVLTQGGKPRTNEVYRSEKGVNFMLEQYRRELQTKYVYAMWDKTDGMLTTLCLLADKQKGSNSEMLESCIEILLSMAENRPCIVTPHLSFGDNRIKEIERDTVVQKIGGYEFHAKPLIYRYWILAYQVTRQYPAAWEKLGNPEQLMEKVRTALIEREQYYVSCMLTGLYEYSNMGNIFDTGLRAMAEMAVYCDYPKALLDCAHFIDAQSRLYFAFDNVEAESGSYQAQFMGHLGRSTKAAGYALQFLHEKNIIRKGSGVDIYIESALVKARNGRKGDMHYPNGDCVRIGDTWGNPSDRHEFAGCPTNICPGWGYFPLCSSKRTFAGLIMEPQIYSHHHDDDLSIVLWGSGYELLADYGYNKAFYRYFTTVAVAHNESSVWWKGEPELSEEGLKAKTACEEYLKTKKKKPYPNIIEVNEEAETYRDLIAERHAEFNSYHEGQAELNFKKWRGTSISQYIPYGDVTYVDASSPRQLEQGIKVRQRTVLLVPQSAGSAYVFDLHRLSGGDAHQIDLQGPFKFNCDAEYSAKPLDKGFVEKNHKWWQKRIDGAYKSSFKNITYRSGAEPWNFSWRLRTNAATLNVWGDGDSAVTLLCGETPDLTRDKYRGEWVRPKDSPPVPYTPHFCLRRENTNTPAGKLESVIPLIYEHCVTSQTNAERIVSIRYKRWNKNDSYGWNAPVGALVEFASGRIDYIYASRDSVPRRWHDFTFRGSLVWLATHRSAEGETPLADAVMTARNASVKGGAFELKSDATQSNIVKSASYSLRGQQEIGLFRVKGSIKNPEKQIGKWVQVDYGNCVSYIYHVLSVRGDGGDTLVEVTGRPGLEKGKDCWAHTGYPYKVASNRAVMIISDHALWMSDKFRKSIGE